MQKCMMLTDDDDDDDEKVNTNYCKRILKPFIFFDQPINEHVILQQDICNFWASAL